MRILIAGASGFIGHALSEALTAAGHTVIRGMRTPSTAGDVAIDFTAPNPHAWQHALKGCDAAINAVGILRERGKQTFSALHTTGPQAFFRACAEAGVRRVIQISAQGAQRSPEPFLASKRQADDFLCALPIEWQIVRPALVYGEAGTSARFFRTLASLPLSVLPDGGRQEVHSVHIDDLCNAVLHLLEPDTPAQQCIELAGQPITLRELIATYRNSMGFAPAPCIAMPGKIMQIAARAGDWLPNSLLNSQTLRLLQAQDLSSEQTQHCNTRPPNRFIRPAEAPALRQAALASWRAPLLRVSLAMVWLITACVSLFVWPIEDSFALLARTGLTGTFAWIALIGAASPDAVLGIALCLPPVGAYGSRKFACRPATRSLSPCVYQSFWLTRMAHYKNLHSGAAYRALQWREKP